MIRMALSDTCVRMFLRMYEIDVLHFEHFPKLRLRFDIDRNVGVWEFDKDGDFEVLGTWPSYTAKAMKYNLGHRVDVVFEGKLSFQDAKHPLSR